MRKGNKSVATEKNNNGIRLERSFVFNIMSVLQESRDACALGQPVLRASQILVILPTKKKVNNRTALKGRMGQV